MSTINLPNIKTTSQSRVYLRETIGSLTATTDGSKIYSRKIARDIFACHPEIELVEYVTTGNKTDSQIIRRGDDYSLPGTFVYVCSTGGKWGKSALQFKPAR